MLVELYPVDFQNLFEASPDPYLLVQADDPAFTIIDVNESYLRVTMTTRQQLIRRSFFDIFTDNPPFFDDDALFNLKNSFYWVIQQKKPDIITLHQYDIRRPVSEGSGFEERWWRTINTPVIRDGKVQHIIHRIEDVTEYCQIEREHTRLMLERDRIFDVAINIMMIVNAEGKIIKVNRAWTETLGWEADEAIGQCWINYMHPDDVKRTNISLKEIFSKPSVWEMDQRYLCKDSSYRWLRWRGKNYPDEKLFYVSAIDITEHKKNELALRQTEQRMNIALEASEFVGTWDWDIINDCAVADKRFATFFSIDPTKAAQGAPLAEYTKAIHPEDLPQVEKAIWHSVNTQEPYDISYRLVQKDGSVRWIHARGRVSVDEKGKPARFPGVAIDITSERETMEALKRSEQRWRTLTEAMPQLVWIGQADESGVYLSSQWEKYSGTPVESLRGYGWLNIVHPDDRQSVLDAWKTAVKDNTEYNIEYRLRRYDGIYHWFKARAIPVRDETSKTTIWYGTCTDIQDQKEASEALRKAKDYLQLIVESAKDFAIIAIDINCNITSWNQGAELIFGYSSGEMIGQFVGIFFTPEDQAHHVPEQEIINAKQRGSAADERWHIRKNGTRFFASGIMTAMYDDTGQLQGFTKIARDITDKKYYEEMLISARNEAEAANRAKSEFLANMSHEIRTPMNSVIGSTELLLNTALTSEQQEYTQTIYQGGEILLSLINDILDFSKIEAGEMELHPAPFSITALTDEIIHIFKLRAEQNNVALTLEAPDDIPSTIVGDSKRLRQIIFNLVGNAVKFTKKGTIKLKIIKIFEDKDNLTLRFEVGDTGIGIARDKINTIFEKFVQADSLTNKKYGGTGLGLAISKQLVELMGGTINARSELGKGSCFYVEIPFKRATKGEFSDVRAASKEKQLQLAESVSVAATQPVINAKVLLVEDYPPNQKVAKTMLEKMGCTVDVAEDGEEAIEKLHKQHYDIVLMDCQMPEMDGFEATRLIRQDKELAGNIIIAMTANALEGDREKCIAAGMDDYIAKPIRSKEIIEIMHQYLDKKEESKTKSEASTQEILEYV